MNIRIIVIHNGNQFIIELYNIERYNRHYLAIGELLHAFSVSEVIQKVTREDSPVDPSHFSLATPHVVLPLPHIGDTTWHVHLTMPTLDPVLQTTCKQSSVYHLVRLAS